MSHSGAFKINRPTRRCAVADRPLNPGEVYFSVVFEVEEEFQRRDYAAENWQGLPDGGLAFWKRRMPEAGPKKLVPAPPEILIDILRQMERFPEKAATRYLLALTLLRRRIIQLAAARDQNTLTVTAPDETDPIHLDICQIDPQEMESIQSSLEELLFAEADDADDDLQDDLEG